MKYALRFSIFILLQISIFFLSLTKPTQSQSWTELFPTGSNSTIIRFGHTAVYDSVNNLMTIFGGISPFDFMNDVWELSTANGLGGTPVWTQLNPTPDSTQSNNGYGGLPPERFGHTVIYDNVNNLMTIFGGWNDTQGDLNDVWVLSTANGLGGTPAWTQLNPTPDPTYGLPLTRYYHTAVYDATHNLMTIFGGWNYNGFLNDVWVLNNANGLGGTPAWTQLSPTGGPPAARFGQTAIYDATHNLMTVFGGYINVWGFLDDVWVLSNANGLGGTPAWTELNSNPDPKQINNGYGGLPAQRYEHTAVYDATNNRMTIFGGNGWSGNLNDVWVLYNANGLDSTTSSWTQLFPTGSTPLTRDGHTAVYDAANNRMTIFGGEGNSGYLNDVWVLDDANGLYTPPTFPYIPSLKLFSDQSILHAFDLDDYNTGGISTSYSILINFLDLSSLDSSSVNQATYSIATVGTNIYLADNAYGEGTATNEVKYSTYKIYKLPKVGLTAGAFWVVNVANYTYNSTGLAIPPSFGNPDALVVSDPTSIFATWLGNTAILLISLQAFSNPVEVDVTASPNASAPLGVDIDKERIDIYSNLLSHNTFSSAQDTTYYGLEPAPSRSNMASHNWLSNYIDSAGTQANGVWQFTFADSSTGIKVTPFQSSYVSMSANQWYTFRLRLAADSSNSHEGLLFGFSNLVENSSPCDIAGNVFFGIPTVWTWQETPLLVHSNSTSGYPQFIFKADSPGNVYVDEIQIINSAPTLVDSNRYNTQLHYPYGEFHSLSDTTGWGQEIYPGAGSVPGISVSNDSLQLNFSGASSGTGQEGIKWTANDGGSSVYTVPVTLNRQVGVRMTVNTQSGSFNSLAIVYVSAMGVQNSNQLAIAVSPSNMIAAAGVGSLVDGTYRTVGTAINPYYQFQFGVRSDQPGILVVSDVDFDTDQDDPNFGDPTLFP